jgi:hypothetical protein
MKENYLFVKEQIVRNGALIGVLVCYSNGRIGAEIKKDKATLRRKRGFIGEGEVILKLKELRILDSLCKHWVKNRSCWAAFFSSSAGYPAGLGGAWYYQAPGEYSKPIKIGSRIMSSKEGEEFSGQDTERLLPKPITLSGGAIYFADLWRIGEKQGNPNGELTGQAYRIGKNITVYARRDNLRIEKKDGSTAIEAGPEDEFLHELIMFMENQTYLLNQISNFSKRV